MPFLIKDAEQNDPIKLDFIFDLALHKSSSLRF